jgi:hypothetical protein
MEAPEAVTLWEGRKITPVSKITPGPWRIEGAATTCEGQTASILPLCKPHQLKGLWPMLSL